MFSKIKIQADKMTVVNTAKPRKPIPVARPIAIASKTASISFDEPAAERNLIRLKVPATATPAPKFPFTKAMITAIKAGMRLRVITNSFV